MRSVSILSSIRHIVCIYVCKYMNVVVSECFDTGNGYIFRSTARFQFLCVVFYFERRSL